MSPIDRYWISVPDGSIPRDQDRSRGGVSKPEGFSHASLKNKLGFAMAVWRQGLAGSKRTLE
jgi:hypothetical protein